MCRSVSQYSTTAVALASILHPFLIMALVVFLIHRKTFYLHYTCIEALFEDLLGQITEEYYHAIDQLPIDAPFTEVNRVFFEFTARQEPSAFYAHRATANSPINYS